MPEISSHSAINPVEDYLELSRLFYLFSSTGQPCDIVFFDKKPLYAVTISMDYSEKIDRLMLTGNFEALADEARSIELDGSTNIDGRDVWMLVPLPFKPFTESQLSSIDTSSKDKLLPSGVTLSAFIANAYQTDSEDEADYFLRRYLASQPKNKMEAKHGE